MKASEVATFAVQAGLGVTALVLIFNITYWYWRSQHGGD